MLGAGAGGGGGGGGGGSGSLAQGQWWDDDCSGHDDATATKRQRRLHLSILVADTTPGQRRPRDI